MRIKHLVLIGAIVTLSVAYFLLLPHNAPPLDGADVVEKPDTEPDDNSELVVDDQHV